MEVHHRSLANRIHGLGHTLLKPWIKEQQWMTGRFDGTWTIDHEKIRNTACPSATPEDNRRQLCNRNKEDAVNSTQ